jgi:bifunctional enzyme CysN/CysC
MVPPVGHPDLIAAHEALRGEAVEADIRRAGFDDAGGTSTADALRVTIAWAAQEPLLRGRAYELDLRGRSVTATVAPIKYRLDPMTGDHLPATAIGRGEIGVCDLELAEPVAFDSDSGSGRGGTFTLVDRISGEPVGAGLIQFELRRSQNVRWQALAVDKAARATSLGQLPTVLWLTGLSGAGKSTIANLVEAELHRRGHHTYMLDGDNVRHGLNSDLGFTDADRVENIRRVGEVARLMVDAGLIVIVSFISPFRAERAMARSLLEPGEFVEVHVDAPLEVAEARDPKGLYRKARSGRLSNFTGIDSPYEPPEDPEIRIDTVATEPAEAAGQVVSWLARGGRLG